LIVSRTSRGQTMLLCRFAPRSRSRGGTSAVDLVPRNTGERLPVLT
jgi:hypothetical protein